MAKEKIPDVPLDVVDPDGIQVRSFLSGDGRYEYPDPVPMAPPIGYKPEPDLGELIRSLVHRELSKVAGASELDTFEEAEDFDIEDDPLDPLTPYEKVFEPPPRQTALPAAPSPVEAPNATEGPVASPAPVSPAPAPPTASASTVPST